MDLNDLHVLDLCKYKLRLMACLFSYDVNALIIPYYLFSVPSLYTLCLKTICEHRLDPSGLPEIIR